MQVNVFRLYYSYHPRDKDFEYQHETRELNILDNISIHNVYIKQFVMS